MVDRLRTIERLVARRDSVIDTLEQEVALAQAEGIGVRALGAALGVSKSKACVVAQRGRAKLDAPSSQDHTRVV